MGTNYTLRYKFCPKCKRSDTIHLGKSSMGWKFGLQYNDGKYYKNWKEMKRFLSKSDGQIFDEYGDKISLKKFIDLVESKQTQQETHKGLGTNVIIDNDGYEFCDYEFC